MTNILVDDEGIKIDGELIPNAQTLTIQLHPCCCDVDVSIVDGLDRITRAFKIEKVDIKMAGYQVSA